MSNHNDDYLWDRSGPDDPEIKRLENLLSAYRSETVASPLPEREERDYALWAAIPLAVAATLLVAFFGQKMMHANQPSVWDVASLTGTPRIDAQPVTASATIAEGQWLVTDDTSRAVISVGSLGCVEVDRASRVRLISARRDDYRLELRSGSLHATTWAPPKLFSVVTPSATAIDLGCDYSLTVDSLGRGRVCVTSGRVALKRDRRESVVSAGAMCETRPGVGPGTPFFGGGSDEFRDALARYDFNGGKREDLATVLRESGKCELYTLWQLLHRVDAADRALVYDRMAMIVPPPAGVTREGVLALDAAMLDVWGSTFAHDDFLPCLSSCTAQRPAGPDEPKG
jgi:hypothetical protein